MLKPPFVGFVKVTVYQPPSGGCVLKLRIRAMVLGLVTPAAFGRLCVETKCFVSDGCKLIAPAAFGRLCVETDPVLAKHGNQPASRLRAAVC